MLVIPRSIIHLSHHPTFVTSILVIALHVCQRVLVREPACVCVCLLLSSRLPAYLSCLLISRLLVSRFCLIAQLVCPPLPPALTNLHPDTLFVELIPLPSPTHLSTVDPFLSPPLLLRQSKETYSHLSL
jgi:hypothetical protein